VIDSTYVLCGRYLSSVASWLRFEIPNLGIGAPSIVCDADGPQREGEDRNSGLGFWVDDRKRSRANAATHRVFRPCYAAWVFKSSTFLPPLQAPASRVPRLP
jgi:hypothetical protein